jgi:hypothetical protein
MPMYKIYILIYETGKMYLRIRLLYDMLKRSPASRASIIVHCGLNEGEADDAGETTVLV